MADANASFFYKFINFFSFFLKNINYLINHGNFSSYNFQRIQLALFLITKLPKPLK